MHVAVDGVRRLGRDLRRRVRRLRVADDPQVHRPVLDRLGQLDHPHAVAGRVERGGVRRLLDVARVDVRRARLPRRAQRAGRTRARTRERGGGQRRRVRLRLRAGARTDARPHAPGVAPTQGVARLGEGRLCRGGFLEPAQWVSNPPQVQAIMTTSQRPTTMTGDEIVALSKQHTHLRVVRAGRGRSDSRRPRQGRVFLDAGRQALPRLQQPVDVRQHRPRRRARDRRRSRSRRRRWPTPTRSWPPRSARRLGAKLAGDHARATSTRSSSPTAAPRPTRTPSRSRGWSPAATRSWRAIARTTARTAGSHRAHRRSAPLGGRARHPRRRATCSTRTTACSAGWDAGRRTSLATLEEVIQLEGPHTRSPAFILETVTGTNGDPRPARRLPAGRARAVRQARHPDDRRRGHGRLRPHRRVVRRRPLERRARPADDGQGPDERLRAAGRGRHAAATSPSTFATRCSTAGSPTTATRWPAPPRWRPSRCTKRTI